MSGSQLLDRLSDLVKKARNLGADAADALMVEGTSVSVSRRLGKPESLTRSEGRDLGLRVLIGHRQAIVSSSDVSPSALADLPARALAMARAVPEDPFCGLADPAWLATDIPDLDLMDAAEPSVEALTEWADRAEASALAVSGVTNSEGASAGAGRASIGLVTSTGFARAFDSSDASVSVSVLAGEGTGMERDYDHTSAVHASDLLAPEIIGRAAGEKAVKRLAPRKVGSGKVVIVFDPRVSRSLVSHLAGAVNGSSVARGTSFLKDKMGERILANGIVVIDDPKRRRGLNSRPFDGEGVATTRRAIVEAGVLKSWILDCRSARQLNLKTTGHAARGVSSPPGPSTSNLHLEPGTMSPEAMIGRLASGFYVTELIGFGVNGVTGDYSRGATGFWIDKGEIAYPVSEVTIAGNLKDMFLNMTVASDLEFRYATNAPTVLVEGMTVAGA